MPAKKVMWDVPSGWQYGFPKKVNSIMSIDAKIKILKDAKYPEKDIEFALQHSRYWIPNNILNKD